MRNTRARLKRQVRRMAGITTIRVRPAEMAKPAMSTGSEGFLWWELYVALGFPAMDSQPDRGDRGTRVRLSRVRILMVGLRVEYAELTTFELCLPA